MHSSTIKFTMGMVMGVSSWLARRPRLQPVTRGLMRALAALAIHQRHLGDPPPADLEDLGRQWQRSFPAKKPERHVPIVAVDDTTVYAEIHSPCPLRGTGDVRACHRMMEYDRAVAGRLGAEFVVLTSQATPGNTYCRVAMRPRGAALDDLVPAHVSNLKNDARALRGSWAGLRRTNGAA